VNGASSSKIVFIAAMSTTTSLPPSSIAIEYFKLRVNILQQMQDITKRQSSAITDHFLQPFSASGQKSPPFWMISIQIPIIPEYIISTVVSLISV
jgi:hypothetical protein